MLVPDRENRLLESAALDLGEEGRKLFFCCQRRLPEWFFCAREVAVSLMLTNRTSDVHGDVRLAVPQPRPGESINVL
jgi:hypothetical protein